MSLVLRCHQLSKELENLCNEEEKSLKVMKSSLKMLEDRHEYITAFLHKMLSTEGQCILRHKAQIEKLVQRILSQRKSLPDTVINFSLSINEHISNSIKNFASFKVTRVLHPAKEKYHNGKKLKNTLKDEEKCNSGLNFESGATLSVSGTTVSQAMVPSMSQTASHFSSFKKSMATSKPVQITQDLTDISSHSSSPILPQSVLPQASQLQQVFRNLSNPLLTTLLLSNASLSRPTVLNVIPTNLFQNNIVMPNVVAPLSHLGAVSAAAVTPAIISCPSLAQPSILFHTVAYQSSNSSNQTNTQFYSLINNQFIPSLVPLAPSVQSILNASINHSRQSIFQSQEVSDNSLSSQISSTSNQIPPYHIAVCKKQSVQVSKSVNPRLNQLQFAQPNVPSNISFLEVLKFHKFNPVLNVNMGKTFTCAPQPAPELTSVPASSNKDQDPPVSSTPQPSAASVSSVFSNTNLVECGSLVQVASNHPVKAPADLVCKGDTRTFPVADESDSHVPTFSVPEEDTKDRENSAVRQPQHLLSMSSVFPDCSFNQSTSDSLKSPHKSISTPSSTGNPFTMHPPSSFRNLVSGEKTVMAKALKQETFPKAQVDDDENTDNLDSELVEGMNEFDEKPIFRQNINKMPLVSLLRLPILGSTLSQFRIVPCSQKDVFLLQEINENQSSRRCIRITAFPTAASLQSDVHDCAVCLSTGVLLQCVECGRSFHTSCHLPPILCSSIEMRVCSLCQDLLDDTDPFRNDRPKEPYLSLPDQRRCEQLLLTLMCENNSYLLYKTSKQTTGYVKFTLIVARLSGKCSPPYRSASEMVSDLWALFDKLLSNSKKKDLIAKLQSTFQQQLNVSFGKTFHASLLKPLSSRDQTGATETDVRGDRAKNTLKRKRDFSAANSTTLAKKVYTGDT